MTDGKLQWTTDQLRKLQHQDPTFEATVDVSGFVPKEQDIIAVAPTYVQGEFFIEEGEPERYHFDLRIITTLTVACSRTLEPVEVEMDFLVYEHFAEDEEDLNRRLEGITIDLLPVVWSNIYLEKPMRVIHPDALDDDRFEPSEEDEGVNPLLSELEKFKG